jgi:hypothetical protein
MLSAKSLHASGRISDKQMKKLAVLRATRSQKSKMAPFDSREKDEGRLGNEGKTPVNEINSREHQDRGGRYGTPTKHGRAGSEGQLHKSHINEPQHQHPKFPSGGDVKASNPKTGNTRMKGGKQRPSGPLYGGPNGRP